MRGGARAGAGAGFAQAGFQKVVHAPWLLPWLRAVVTAISPRCVATRWSPPLGTAWCWCTA